MDSESPGQNNPSTVTLSQISKAASKDVGDDLDLDPWHDDSLDGNKTPVEKPPHQLETPDPSVLDEAVVGGLHVEAKVQPDVQPRPLTEILGEFDPLVHREEVEAREAWENSETHPPQPPSRTPSPAPTPPAKEVAVASPPSSAVSPSGFSSLAAFTRSFTIPIPGLQRPRPLSLDMAKPLTSPPTLSSLGSHPSTPRKRTPEHDVAGGSAPNDRLSESLRPGGSSSQNKDKVDQPFDFQKFLDQMKLKGAEPIAKYLKSCVYSRSHPPDTTDILYFIHD